MKRIIREEVEALREKREKVFSFSDGEDVPDQKELEAAEKERERAAKKQGKEVTKKPVTLKEEDCEPCALRQMIREMMISEDRDEVLDAELDAELEKLTDEIAQKVKSAPKKIFTSTWDTIMEEYEQIFEELSTKYNIATDWIQEELEAEVKATLHIKESKKLEGHVDNPGAFCGSLASKIGAR